MISWIHPDLLTFYFKDEMGAFDAFLAARFKGAQIVIHVDADPTDHVANSQHYIDPRTGKANAADFHVLNVPPIEVWLALSDFPALRGLGWYPWWKSPGFHADGGATRPQRARATWFSTAKGVYVRFDATAIASLLKGGV